MKCLILAAGQGGRMKPLSYYVHKAMLPLADGRPVLEHIVDYLFSYGHTPVIALSKENHYKEVMEFFGPKFEYSISEKPLGTAGEIWHARDLLKGEDRFMVYYGDTLTDANLRAMEDIHEQKNAMLTVCGYDRRPYDYGVIDYVDKQVLKIMEKPILNNMTVLPIFICEKKVLDYVCPYKDFVSDSIKHMLDKNENIALFKHHGKLKDMGKLTDYAKEIGLE